MADTFAKFIAKERARLKKEHQRLLKEQDAVAAEIAALQRELQAVNAYEQTKKGQSARAVPAARRGRRSSRRASILDLLKSSDGLGRGEILVKMGLKGDKSGEQSVSNALNALKKAGEVVAKDRKYRLAN
jgi:hypothetical protein